MAERHAKGVLDTCTYIALASLDPEVLPKFPHITAVTMAELHQGVVMTADPVEKSLRNEQLGAAIVEFEPLPFDGEAAARYGTMVALTIAAGRSPRPRQLDLMIAAIASTQGLPLYTRNPEDFRGLESQVEVVEI
ncbi:type II toxin-antitoxin system VapC family toxin [Amycolatopsis sp. NPDC023774]|uniref:type II toxin-antitoxin system VapC family toxin n=1 Tax=Amycolatopsis sp. NPDC023774 TaxID=3155015 RepID=UPI003406ABFB